MNDFKNNSQTNRLSLETSPYLLQHARNPVDWYPWGEEALNKAKVENKPIFLSIGYSACHWCHVMAHESFEDQEVAKIMNDNFVNIKVDREERPDIDDIYQRVCQLASGTGGWPLSVFLTPDQRPFYVGTYFPKDGGKYGMPGFMTILRQLADAYNSKQTEIDSASAEFMTALSQTSRDVLASADNSEVTRSILDEGAVGLLHMADSIYGGFGQAPKFPNPMNLMFLLRYYDISGLTRFKDFVLFTCDKMAGGGIFDHLGGGFSRYSTDQKWLVPHFEKMLYDNSLLVCLYAEAYQLTKDQRYVNVVRMTLDFILREMTDTAGGFYSALDADSEGEEGKFYVWSKKEIFEILSDRQNAQIFCDYYGVTEGGNFEGKNILNVRSSVAMLAQKYSTESTRIEQILSECRTQLLRTREKRVRPSRDEKVLISWNGLAISAFVKGFMVTGDNRYLEAAINAVENIESNLVRLGGGKSGLLYHSLKDGKSQHNAYLDDYAFYASALLDLFSVESKPRYLELAIRYADYMLAHFWDENQSGFFFTSDDHEKLIVRTKNFYDLAIPSGNSAAALVLLKLHFYTQIGKYSEHANKIMRAGARAAAENPFGFGQLLICIYLYIKKPLEITIIKKTASSPMGRWLHSTFLPDAITAVALQQDTALLQNYSYFKGRADVIVETAFVCRNFACSLPIETLSSLQNEIEARKT